MKVSYRACSEYGPEFDDPISCQTYEKVLAFLEEQDSESDWSYLQDLHGSFDSCEYTLKYMVERRDLFVALVDQIKKAEAEVNV